VEDQVDLDGWRDWTISEDVQQQIMCDMNAAMLRQVSSTKTDAQINRTYPNLV